MNNFNIIEFISNNPILRLTKSCNNKLLIKIKETFTNFEQQLFINSFYCYLNYNNSTDFVIDLDNIWKWLGYSIKHNAKTTVEKYFKENIDYKIIDNKLAPGPSGASYKTINRHGGNNRQIIMLNVKCFKSLCLKSRTDKADQIHDYYIKLEELINKTVEEETDELRLQLKRKDEIISEVKEESEYQKQRAVENTLFSLFPINTECIYIGTIQNSNEENETLIKFGHSNDLHKRVLEHRKTYNNFILIKAFKVQNKVEIEKLIKTHCKIKPQIRTICINNKNKTELIAYNNNFTIDNIIQCITDIINSKTYSIDNFNKLLKENEDLIKENENLHIKLKDNNIELTKYILENNELKTIIVEKEKLLKTIEEENKSPYHNELVLEDTLTKSFNEFIDSMCIIHNEVEDSSTNLEGQYRIWCKTKPKKETFHAFKNYLDTRFKPIRLKEQTKNQIVYGYKGCKLKELEYKKKYTNNDAENFLFQVCKFCPNGKILNSKLLEEYVRWKKNLDKEVNNNEVKEIKEYLNNCDYVLKSTVWTDYGSNEGYYGLILKEDEYKHKTTSSTGKQIQKKEISTNIIVGKWETIAKAAQSENLSASKMSRSIKNNIIFNNKYIYELC